MGVTKKPLSTFELSFTSQRAYSPGDKVAGRLRLQAASGSVLRLRSVRIVALGYARAQLLKGSQPLRQQQEYLHYRDTLQPEGEAQVKGQYPGGAGGSGVNSPRC